MTFHVDIKSICSFLGITNDEFDKLTIAQIKDTQQKIKIAAIEERRNDPQIMEDYRFFFKSYDKFVQYFGKELTDKYLPVVPLNSLVDKEHVRKGERTYKSPAQLIGGGFWSFPRRRGPGSRSGVTDHLPADIYKVAGDYQGLKHEDIVHPILKELTPWLSEFKISVYEISNNQSRIDEFYLKTEGDNNSLYVPYEAFVNGDVQGIIERNERYLTGWYNGEKGKISFENLMQTPTVQKFLQLVPSNAKKEQS